ncbi:efflux transporter outer membrane subunit [Marinobacter sp. JSM 1782161]|uniref:efflux transporter outer membrane subunit n=1 Tax=Marinobacter sp. JSM 1782161 TaxID=2685906 RepID=UPI001402CF26|nr:efflux transporter outer membrane subunit [Marinobacter sp. JSM 1782161]
MRKRYLALAPLLLAGCAVGPDYQTPDVQAPEQFSEARDSAPFSAADEARFWGGFNDPVLANLIDDVMTDNQTLQAALARFERADALLRGARADRMPAIGASASARSQHLAEAERTSADTGDADVDVYRVSANASWELDLFGRLRRASEAQAARLQAAGAELDALRVSLAGEVAASYFELRGLQQQLDVARNNVRIQRESLDIVRSRLDAGRSTRFDERRAEAQLERTRAALPQLEADVRVRMHRIAVLSGRAPGELIPQLSEAEPLPSALPLIPAGTPGDVLRRRPDILAAERQLAAATADIGVATADLYPRFSLDALLGSVAVDGGDLFSAGAESRAVGLGIDWSFLNFGRVRSRIDAADADAQAALANYRQAILDALEETENRLVRYARAQERTERLQASARAAREAAELARTRYEQGYIGYFEVLDAEREQLDSENALEQGRTASVLAMVNLYRALAGAPGKSEQATASKAPAASDGPA